MFVNNKLSKCDFKKSDKTDSRTTMGTAYKQEMQEIKIEELLSFIWNNCNGSLSDMDIFQIIESLYSLKVIESAYNAFCLTLEIANKPRHYRTKRKYLKKLIKLTKAANIKNINLSHEHFLYDLPSFSDFRGNGTSPVGFRKITWSKCLANSAKFWSGVKNKFQTLKVKLKRESQNPKPDNGSHLPFWWRDNYNLRNDTNNYTGSYQEYCHALNSEDSSFSSGFSVSSVSTQRNHYYTIPLDLHPVPAGLDDACSLCSQLCNCKFFVYLAFNVTTKQTPQSSFYFILFIHICKFWYSLHYFRLPNWAHARNMVVEVVMKCIKCSNWVMSSVSK